MTTHIPFPDPANIKNYPTDRKAVMIWKNNIIRVVERQYYRDNSKKGGCEKRTYLGYVVDNCYYSTEEYQSIYMRNRKKRLVSFTKKSPSEQVGALTRKVAAEIPIYHAIAKDIGLVDDLTSVWGSEKANAILSIAYHWLNTSSNAAYLYNTWSLQRILPYKESMCSKKISLLFENIANTDGWRKNFFGARVARLPEKEMLSFDATEIASNAAEISYAQWGVGKEGGYQKQVGLILLMGHKTHMPVLFRVLPGNITDVTTVQDMLFRFDTLSDEHRVFGAVVDRGYFSLANLARFVDAGSRVIMAAKTNVKWIRDAIDKSVSDLYSHATHIPGDSCWGCTVPVEPKFDDGIKRKLWVHVYRSDLKSHNENTQFYNDLMDFEREWLNWTPKFKGETVKTCYLRNSPMMKYFIPDCGIPGVSPLVEDYNAIDSATRYFGIFCNVTTMECSARDALSTYRTRDLIEKAFKSGKSDLQLDVSRSHNDSTLEGRFVVGFVALSILTRLRTIMKEDSLVKTAKEFKRMQPLGNEITFNELKNSLSAVSVVYDNEGIGHWEEVTQKQHMIAARLGFPDVYKTLPDWV